MRKKITQNQKIHLISVFIVIVCFAWAILPMLLLRENYVFTIHDGLDSYAGIVQMIHDHHLYFSTDQTLPIMNGLEGKYTFITYTLYDALNCLLGYLPGQILTRIIGTFIGFFSLKHLLNTLYKQRNMEPIQKDLLLLLSAAYAITPVAPNRMFAFASLPMVMELFLFLSKSKNKLSKWIWFALVIPVLSIFDAVLVFVLGFWVLFTVIVWIKEKKFNYNLGLAFVLMCISTLVVNINFLKVALVAEETSRGLLSQNLPPFNFENLKKYLLNGQYHSTALQSPILLPFLAIGTIYAIYCYKKRKDEFIKNQLLLLGIGWTFWFLSALFMTYGESGFRTGILLIDGFMWVRVIGIMRIVWYLMYAAVIFATFGKRQWHWIMYVAISLQLINVAINTTIYNDTLYSMVNAISDKKFSNKVNFREFFSTDLFDEIKEDINYNYEGVVAYGFHPSVLLYNDFCTIDGYFSVHPMKWQNEFREIIEPDLEINEEDREYYDTFGGRMYIFGPLDYSPTDDKDVEPTDCYISVDALKKYGGRYILSRAPIANADELGIMFVNDYDNQDSLYHIYLYKVE